MNTRQKRRVIARVLVLCAVVSAVAAVVTVPEVRTWLGLDGPKIVPTLVQDIPSPQSQPTSPKSAPSYAPVDGYAYYGIWEGNDWIERHFRTVGSTPASFPQ